MSEKNKNSLPYSSPNYRITIDDGTLNAGGGGDGKSNPSTVFDANFTSPVAIPGGMLQTSSSSSSDDHGGGGKKKELIRENGISATATLINFLKGMIGPGCLSLPLAFKQAGLVTTFVLIVAFGFLNNYCMLQLVHCSQKLSRRKGNAFMDYGTVAYEACAESFKSLRKYRRHARLIVNTAIIALQIGICSVFYVFVAVHLKEVCDHLTNWHLSELAWMFLVFLPMILISMLRTLKTIAIISAVGNVLMIASLVFIFQSLIRAEHQWGNLPWITSFNGVMTACGSILYSFEGQAMVLPMENRLKRPSDMVGPFGVLSIGMSAVTSVYAMAGLSGYVTYGERVRGSITQNLPDDIIFIIVRLMLTLVIYFSYVIQLYVIVDMVWPRLRSMLGLDLSAERSRISSTTSSAMFGSNSTVASSSMVSTKKIRIQEYGAEFLFRTTLVLLTMIIAICVPNLDNIIPLVGVTAGMLLAFIFPATIDTICFVPQMLSENDGRFTRPVLWKLLQNGSLCLVGLFGLVFGLKSNIEDIIIRQAAKTVQ